VLNLKPNFRYGITDLYKDGLLEITDMYFRFALGKKNKELYLDGMIIIISN